MIKTKLTYLFIAALLTTTHHNQVKAGIPGAIITITAISAVAVYIYKGLSESQKKEVDKAVDAGADTTTKVIKAGQEKANEFFKK